MSGMFCVDVGISKVRHDKYSLSIGGFEKKSKKNALFPCIWIDFYREDFLTMVKLFVCFIRSDFYP
jgi:hypothetical protein